MNIQRHEVTISLPVNATYPEPLALAATVYFPEHPTASAPVMFFFAGGGNNRTYYDLMPDGCNGYSQAEHHANLGNVVVAMDYLGAGESSIPVNSQLVAPPKSPNLDRFASPSPLTLAVIASTCDMGVHTIVAKMREGSISTDVRPIQPSATLGIGQSFGGHVAIATQANHGTFDAVAALGSSFTQTRLALRAGARYPLRNAEPAKVLAAALADTDYFANSHWPGDWEAFAEVHPALGKSHHWRSNTTPLCATTLMEPYVLAHSAAAVRVPVFLAYGEIDVTPDPSLDACVFRSSCDVWTAIIPKMAHLHNFSASRRQLWDRLDTFVSFVSTVANRRRESYSPTD